MASITFSLPAPEITYGSSHSSLTVTPINSSQCCVAPKIERLRLTTTHVRRRRFPCKPLQALRSTGPEDLNHLTDKVPPSPLIELTQKFYSSLNGQDIKKLEKLIAPDLFPNEFCREELQQQNAYLLTRLIHRFPFHFSHKGSGRRNNCLPRCICTSVQHTVISLRPVSYFQSNDPNFSGNYLRRSLSGNTSINLFYREAHVFVESPLKPGDLGPVIPSEHIPNFMMSLWFQKMLKLITFLFDKLPNLAESFLNKPEAVVYYMVKIYEIFVRPLILPLVAYYTFIWAFVVQIVTIALSFLRKIPKIFG